MGFDGRLNQKDNNPSTELLLAWALWVQLRGDDANNPVGVARSKWRRGEFPETYLTGYAKDILQDVLDVAYGGGDVANALDVLAADFGRPSGEIPAEYRDTVKR